MHDRICCCIINHGTGYHEHKCNEIKSLHILILLWEYQDKSNNKVISSPKISFRFYLLNLRYLNQFKRFITLISHQITLNSIPGLVPYQKSSLPISKEQKKSECFSSKSLGLYTLKRNVNYITYGWINWFLRQLIS